MIYKTIWIILEWSLILIGIYFLVSTIFISGIIQKMQTQIFKHEVDCAYNSGVVYPELSCIATCALYKENSIGYKFSDNKLKCICSK